MLGSKAVGELLLLLGDWALTMDGMPHLRDPLDTIFDIRHQRYLANRDEQRQGGPKWVSLSLVASVKWFGPRLSYTDRARQLRLTYDWYYHGLRAVLGLKQRFPQPLPCLLCQEDDSQFHMLCDCQHPSMLEVREEGLRRLMEYVNSYAQLSWQHTLLSTFFQLLLPTG